MGGNAAEKREKFHQDKISPDRYLRHLIKQTPIDSTRKQIVLEAKKSTVVQFPKKK